MPQAPLYQDDKGRVEIAVGHDPCRPEDEGAELAEKEGDDGGECRQVDNAAPDLKGDAGPGERGKLVPAEEQQPTCARDQDPEGHERHGLIPMEEFDQGHIKGHEQAAGKEEQVPGVEVKGEELAEAAAKENPDRAQGGRQHGREPMATQPLLEQDCAVQARDPRYQGEDHPGVQGRGRAHGQEHKPEEAGQGEADAGIAEQAFFLWQAEPILAVDIGQEEQGRDGKAQQGEHCRVHCIGDGLAHGKGGGDQPGAEQHHGVDGPQPPGIGLAWPAILCCLHGKERVCIACCPAVLYQGA